MKVFWLVAMVSLAALAGGCGGGGSSANEETIAAGEQIEGRKEPEGQQLAKEHEAARQRHKEMREEREDAEFLEAEEKRIEEKERAQTKKKHHPPKPEPEPESESLPTGVDPIAVEEFEGFSTEPDHNNWEIAFGICAVTPEKQLAKEFHTEQNWAAIGHAYGQGYSEPFNIAAEEGCMVALKDSESQREAMFALMEANE